MNLQSEKQLQCLLVLNALAVSASKNLWPLFHQGHSPDEILDELSGSGNPWRDLVEKVRLRFDPLEELEECRARGISLVTYWDEDYPESLKHLAQPPILLYQKGALVPSDRYAMAVVGSRHPSFYGIGQARRFSRQLSEYGLTIVSGLARGIDRSAHEETLNVPYGRTIAVLGCGLIQNYPPEGQTLKEKIQARGAVLSEFPLATPPWAGNFPRRNRIIAGLSLGVLVVEAHLRSGSLITAHQALEEGREVFAVPGPVDQPTSGGTHRLIREGALLVESPGQILDELSGVLISIPRNGNSLCGPSAVAGQKTSAIPETEIGINPPHAVFSNKEDKIFSLLLESPLLLDEICERLPELDGIPAALLTLECKQRIHKNLQGRYETVSNVH